MDPKIYYGEIIPHNQNQILNLSTGELPAVLLFCRRLRTRLLYNNLWLNVEGNLDFTDAIHGVKFAIFGEIRSPS